MNSTHTQIGNAQAHSRGFSPTFGVLPRITGIVGFAVLTALAAVKLPVPGTPVPITFQTVAALLAGVTMGPWLGSASMAFYLLLGACGYHVFAGVEPSAGGLWSANYLLGPTGGYLLGMLLAQPVVGLITAGRRSGRRLLGSVVAGSAIIFACGVVWLSIVLSVDAGRAIQLGVIPFIPGLMIKSAIVLGVGFPILRYARPRFG
jgi:biotin transport system substrate-specific component